MIRGSIVTSDSVSLSWPQVPTNAHSRNHSHSTQHGIPCQTKRDHEQKHLGQVEDGNQSTIMTAEASFLRGCEVYLNACGDEEWITANVGSMKRMFWMKHFVWLRSLVMYRNSGQNPRFCNDEHSRTLPRHFRCVEMLFDIGVVLTPEDQSFLSSKKATTSDTDVIPPFSLSSSPEAISGLCLSPDAIPTHTTQWLG